MHVKYNTLNRQKDWQIHEMGLDLKMELYALVYSYSVLLPSASIGDISSLTRFVLYFHRM